MRKILELINKIEMALAMVGLVAFTSVIFFGSVFRAFGNPLNWSADIALFIFAWSTFLGGDVAFRDGKVINVELLVQRFSVEIQKIIAVLVYAIIIIFLVFMVVFGIDLCFTTGHRTFNGVQGLSYVWVTLSIPICFSLMTLTAINRLIHLLRSNDKNQICKM